VGQAVAPAEAFFSSLAAVCPTKRDRSDLRIQSLKQFTVRPGAATIKERVPASSVTVYSSYRLEPGDAGIMAER